MMHVYKRLTKKHSAIVALAVVLIGIVCLIIFFTLHTAARQNSVTKDAQLATDKRSNTVDDKPSPGGNVEAETAQDLAKTKNKPSDEMISFSLKCRDFSLRYPSSWKALHNDGNSLMLVSPAHDGRYISLQLLCGKNTEVNQNFLGWSAGSVITQIKGTYYLAAQHIQNPEISGLGLSTTSQGGRVSFGIIDQEGKGPNNITLSANLVVINASPNLNQGYQLKDYQDFAEYSNMLAIFESIESK